MSYSAVSYLRSCCFISIVLAALFLGRSFLVSAPRSPLSMSELRTTSAAIALTNLNAQIDGEKKLADRAALSVAQRSSIADLQAMRGQILGSIADYETVAAISEELTRDAPNDGKSYLARSHARSIFHRFGDALVDLDKAEALGVPQAQIETARASILQASGKYVEALEIRNRALKRNRNMNTLSAAASVYADLGEIEEAEKLYGEAPRDYRDVSPFPIAWLYFQQGLMWMHQGDLQRAREFFSNAHERIPQYAAARGHLAEVEAALGNRGRAVELLEPLAASSDDPDYAAQLARILLEDGQIQQAKPWRDRAASRYEQLITLHPQAFADHATEFWLAAGADPLKALQLARLNLEVRKTPRAYELVLEAALAAKDLDSTCKALGEVSKITHPAPQFKALITHAQTACGLERIG